MFGFTGMISTRTLSPFVNGRQHLLHQPMKRPPTLKVFDASIMISVDCQLAINAS